MPILQFWTFQLCVSTCRWDNRTSVVLPDEDVFYLVALLSSAPTTSGHDILDHALKQNQRILDFCEKAKIGMKQYLPHYDTEGDWKQHYGVRWETFQRRKQVYDPLAILAPGQKIFQKLVFSSWQLFFYGINRIYCKKIAEMIVHTTWLCNLHNKKNWLRL